MKSSKKVTNNPNFFSKVFKIVKNPFFIIGCILLIAVIILVLTNKSQSKPAPASACTDTQVLCGDECIDNSPDSEYICTGDNKKCSRKKYCYYNSTCCSDSDWCDPNKKNCQGCPADRTSCSGTTGQVCCDAGETCTEPENKGECCITDNITKDGCCNPPNIVCTSKDGKTKSCCTAGSGLTCGDDGTCVVGCPDKDNLSLYKCVGDTEEPTVPLQTHKCGDGQACTVDCLKPITDNARYTCIEPDKCNWDATAYYPSLLQYGDAQSSAVINPDNKHFIHQCNDGGNIWIKNSPGVVGRAETHSIPLTGEKEINNLCTLPMCVARIREQSSTVIKGDITSLDNNNYACTSQLDCDKALINDDNTIDKVCTLINDVKYYKGKTLYDGCGRCCKDINKKNTGKVCNFNEFCDNNDNNCYTGFKYNSVNGRCEPSKTATQSFQDCLKTNEIISELAPV